MPKSSETVETAEAIETIEVRDADVTFEAECLTYECGWQATPSTDGAAVDVECMSHTGRTGHGSFRRLCTSFALVVRNE
ncbi:hypothetical protein [Streptomyces sp. NPDC048191]|uniref:DUF7848 domain-containing protein n=1 Tax=Streptomyces sp. NPDC048191 TaxID=3155484 RepID=UPI003401AF71